MTFQVAMLGSDGFIMASDTKIVREAEVRSSSSSTKIFSHPKRGLVCACSGQEVSLLAKDRLFETVEDTPLDQPHMWKVLMEVAGATWRHCYGEEAVVPHIAQEKGTLLVAEFGEQGPKLWTVDIAYTPVCEEVQDKAVAGDRGNPATFILERYFQANSSVDDLSFLAAHTVLLAGQLNSAAIQGLEILICKDGQLRRIGPNEQETLEHQSRELDDLIRQKLLPSRA